MSRPRAVALIGLVGLVGSLGFGLLNGPPRPVIHDEFSYVLAADTYASGRVTNPTHPFWQHFETFHVLHEPTYQSKYPPGQGLTLALGLKLFDDPAVGVWISSGILAAALTWALLVWLPTGWAMVTSLMIIGQVGWHSQWAQSLWGGNVAAIGGALLFGGIGVLLRRPSPIGGVTAGTGMALLAISRPFEGAVASLALLGALAVGTGRSRSAWTRLLRRGGIGLGLLVLAAGLGGIGFHNWKVTGAPLTLPYQVHEAEYSAAPSFLFQSREDPPSYRHDVMERYWLEWGAARHDAFSRWEGQITRQGWRLWWILTFFLGPGLVAFGGLALRRPRSPGVAVAGASAGLVLAGTLATLGGYAHYAAPALAPVSFLVGVGMLRLHRFARRRRILDPAGIILLAWLVLLGVDANDFLRRGNPLLAEQRGVAEQVMQSRSGPHLVLVTYEEGHDYHMEWVYNRADIDAAEIVWARSMGEERDRKLREYFADRRVWLLTAGQELTLVPHEGDGADPSDPE